MSATIILITGANAGLGLELIHSLYRSTWEYKILMGSRSLEKAKEAIKDIEARRGANKAVSTEPIQLDVEVDDSIQSAFDLVKRKYGRLDVLINNAGVLSTVIFIIVRIYLD